MIFSWSMVCVASLFCDIRFGPSSSSLFLFFGFDLCILLIVVAEIINADGTASGVKGIVEISQDWQRHGEKKKSVRTKDTFTL